MPAPDTPYVARALVPSTRACRLDTRVETFRSVRNPGTKGSRSRPELVGQAIAFRGLSALAHKSAVKRAT